MTGSDLSRRELLLTTGVGVVSIPLISEATVANQSVNEIIYQEDFEGYSPGDIPSDIVIAGNSNQKVVDIAGSQGNQSYRMSGSHGGCWQAIARVPLELEDEVTVKGFYKLEAGTEGCHTGSGRIQFRSVASSSWFNGSGTRLLQFHPDGTIESDGTTVGEFDWNKWIKFEIEYIRDNENEEVTHNCKINGNEVVSVTREEDPHEDNLSALELQSNDFTVSWDKISVEKGLTGSGIPDESEPETTIIGVVTDSAGNPLGDVEVRSENQETDEQITATTDANGEYEIPVEADTEYRVFVFDQFGLEWIEFEDFVQLEEQEALEIDITLFSKFEVFEEQKLGSDRIAGLAPRIDDLSTPLISEEETVGSEIQAIEAAMDDGEIDRELAEEAIERMVLGEAMVNRTLESLTDTTPTNLAGYDWSQGPLIFEDDMPDFDLLFQTSKGIVIGLLEAFYSMKKIAKDALGELSDQIISRITSAIGNFIRDLLSDFQGVLQTAENALSIGNMLLEIDDASDEAIERIVEGATFDNVRGVIKDLADPIADQIANSILAAVELLSIDGQLNDLNTTLGAGSLTDGAQFSTDIATVADETQTVLRDIETQVEQADEQMNPESNALDELINLAGELADAGFSDIPRLLRTIWNIVRDLVDIISSGFNIGFGIVRTRQIYTDSAVVVDNITDTV